MDYFLKKEKKEKERVQKAKSKKSKKIIKVFLPISLIIVGVGFLLFNFLSAEEPEPNLGVSKIEIIPLEYDAGTVSMSDALVEKTFEIKNIGEGDLEIDDIKTSCMCTTAILVVGDKKSPEFGMNSNIPFWSQIIIPGEIGYLNVVFDQTFHGPSGTGSAVRTISLITNDPENKEVGVKLLVNVIQ